jgi:hypothetical protein
MEKVNEFIVAHLNSTLKDSDKENDKERIESHN